MIFSIIFYVTELSIFQDETFNPLEHSFWMYHLSNISYAKKTFTRIVLIANSYFPEESTSGTYLPSFSSSLAQMSVPSPLATLLLLYSVNLGILTFASNFWGTSVLDIDATTIRSPLHYLNKYVK